CRAVCLGIAHSFSLVEFYPSMHTWHAWFLCSIFLYINQVSHSAQSHSRFLELIKITPAVNVTLLLLYHNH
uniref:Uncharacterized protein n=1 Tax=Aegilops tauschii subsp. strangulata TaxID=200361 RepID=A0A453GZK3_AEGTS